MCLSWTFSIIGITLYMAFCMWHLSLGTKLSTFIHFIACVIFHSFLWLKNILSVDIPHFVYLSVDERGALTPSPGRIQVKAECLPPPCMGPPSLPVACILALEREVIWAEYTWLLSFSGSSSQHTPRTALLFPNMFV